MLMFSHLLADLAEMASDLPTVEFICHFSKIILLLYKCFENTYNYPNYATII